MSEDKKKIVQKVLLVVLAVVFSAGFLYWWYTSDSDSVPEMSGSTNATPSPSPGKAPEVELDKETATKLDYAKEFIAVDTSFYRDIVGKSSTDYFKRLCDNEVVEGSRTGARANALKMLTPKLRAEVEPKMQVECGNTNVPVLPEVEVKVDGEPRVKSVDSNGVTFQIPVEVNIRSISGKNEANPNSVDEYQSTDYVHTSYTSVETTVVDTDEGLRVSHFSHFDKSWSAIWTSGNSSE